MLKINELNYNLLQKKFQNIKSNLFEFFYNNIVYLLF